MLTLTLYDLSDALSEVSGATMSTKFEGIVDVKLATSNLNKFRFESLKLLPDILMFDLDYNNIEDNVVTVVLDVISRYTEHYPMVIMTHSGADELFEGKYSQLEDTLGSNICLVHKPVEYVKLSRCIMKRLMKMVSNNQRG